MEDIFKIVLEQIKQPLWSNWYIKEEIGSGASSVVYRIEAERGGRTDVSALKIEPVTLGDVLIDDDARIEEQLEKKRLEAVNETTIMYNLKDCRYIVGYQDEDIFPIEHEGRKIGYCLIIRMEYLDCLQKLMRSRQLDLSEENIQKFARQISKAIQAAHSQDIIHRDIKPANFFVGPDGTFKLGDFNISKKSFSARSFAGTEGYIAPEIYRAKIGVETEYTKQADIYSFGICLYQLMNNYYFPFEEISDSTEEAIDRRMRGEPLPMPRNGSPDFAGIILHACEFDPAIRYQTIDEMLADLEALKNGTYSGIPGSASKAPEQIPVQPQPQYEGYQAGYEQQQQPPQQQYADYYSAPSSYTASRRQPMEYPSVNSVHQPMEYPSVNSVHQPMDYGMPDSMNMQQASQHIQPGVFSDASMSSQYQQSQPLPPDPFGGNNKAPEDPFIDLSTISQSGNSGNGKLKLILIICIVVILIAVGALIFILVNNKGVKNGTLGSGTAPADRVIKDISYTQEHKWYSSGDFGVLPYNSFGLVCEWDSGSDSIPQGASKFGGHWYLPYTNYYGFMDEYAGEYCEARGGHLVSFETQEEFDYVYEIASKYKGIKFFWTSGMNNGEKWIWTNSGEEFDYMDFAEGSYGYKGDVMFVCSRK